MTNIVEFETRATVERQAREWLIRLDGDEPLSPAEIAALREWMGRSSTHSEELKRLARFWRQANRLTELAVVPPPKAGTPARFRAVLATASVAIASMLLGWWYFHSSVGAANGTYGTAIGQQETISLPDGSSIELNTDSQVQVQYSNRLRTVRLLRGEALFTVKPDARRAFEVHAADGVVKAVGTAFAVHLEGSTVEVTVTKGVVEVADLGPMPDSAGGKVPGKAGSPHSLGRLKAGEVSSFGTRGASLQVQQLAEPELRRRIAWHEGYLIFHGEPLSHVVEQINRYSPVNLQLGDPRLASVAIGGRFRIGDLDAVLDVLHTNFGIQSHQTDERNIRLDPEPTH